MTNTAQAIAFDDEDETTIQGIHPALDVVNGTLYVTVRASVGKKMQHLILTSDGQGNTRIVPVNDPQEVAWELGVSLRATVDISDLLPRWNNTALRDFQNGTLDAPTWRETYDAIYQAFDDHLVVIDRHYLDVLTLHAMMSYYHSLFDVLPILHLLGPSESDKSRAGVALGEVAFNGKVTGSATPATVFRKADAGRYTQIITEADELANQRSGDAFVKQLQGATTKGEAVVEVAEKGAGGMFRPRTYYAFNPRRVLVSTKDFSKALTLRNRCIRLDFVKSPNADQEKLHRSITGSLVWTAVRDKLYRLQLLRWRDVEAARDMLRKEWVGGDSPTGRIFDKWLPLATMAKLVGDDVLSVVKQLAATSMAEQQEDASHSQMGILCHYMEYVVRNRDESLQRREFWEKLLRSSHHEGEDHDVPDWAKACDDTITCGELKRMFGGEVKFVRELKRKKLIPQEPRQTNRCDIYDVKRADVLAITQQYIGGRDEKNEELRDAVMDSVEERWRSGTLTDEDLPF